MADWTSARAAANELAETGVDPLDVQAAHTARVALVRRFIFDLLMIFGLVAVVTAVGLMVFRAVQGGDPIEGRELWIGSAALVFLLVVIALRGFFPAKAKAYETAWAAFVERVWPGAPAGDDLGGARLRFVKAIAGGGAGDFPSRAPGRKG